MDEITGKLFMYGAKQKISSFLGDGENNDDMMGSVKKTLGMEEEKPKKDEGLLSNVKKTLGFEEEEKPKETSPPQPEDEGFLSGIKKKWSGEEKPKEPSKAAKQRSEERDRIAKKYGLSTHSESSEKKTETRPHSSTYSGPTTTGKESAPSSTSSAQPQEGIMSRWFGWKSQPSNPETAKPAEPSNPLESAKSSKPSNPPASNASKSTQPPPVDNFASLMILETMFEGVDDNILRKALRDNNDDVQKAKKYLISKGYKAKESADSGGGTVSEKNLKALKKEFPNVDEDVLKSTLQEFGDDPKKASEFLKKNNVEPKKKGWFG